MIPCTRLATASQYRTPLCGCPACHEERMAAARRAFVRGVEDGPELDWDYERQSSRSNAELGE